MSLKRRTTAILLLSLTCVLSLACAGTQASPTPPAPLGPAQAQTRPAGCAPARAKGDDPVVDDFEGPPGRISAHEGRTGEWFDYHDESAGKLTRETVALEGKNGSGHALHVAISGFAQWGAGFGFSFNAAGTPPKECIYDASAYSGIRLRARGHGRVRLQLGDPASTPVSAGGTCTRSGVACFDRSGAWLDLDDDWRTYSLPFCSLYPEGWGAGKNSLDPTQLMSLHVRVSKREQVDLWLDDLSFYRALPGSPEARCGRPCPLDEAPRTATIVPTRALVPLSKELSLFTFEQPTDACGTLVRRYLSFVPSTIKASSAAPVLIVLHGSGFNAESARNLQTHARFETLAARDGFIVVYGNAAPGPETQADPESANSGAWRTVGDGQHVDDLDYLERVLADLKSRKIIRGDHPIFLAGFSNGGGMALEAARRRPDRFSGVAAIMPFLGPEPAYPADVSQARLQRILFAYSLADPSLPPDYHQTVAELSAHWATALGIPDGVIRAPVKTVLPDLVVEGDSYTGPIPAALATRDSHVSQLDLAAAGRGVRVLVLDHAGHGWPTPTPDTAAVFEREGFRNQDFDASDAVWEYLRGALGEAHAKAR